jgi:hypothetical protein
VAHILESRFSAAKYTHSHALLEAASGAESAGFDPAAACVKSALSAIAAKNDLRVNLSTRSDDCIAILRERAQILPEAFGLPIDE